MTEFEVLGFRKGERTSKNGVKYIGCNVYLAYEDPSIIGLGCLDVFTMGNSVPSQLSAGDKVHVIYNRFGRVEAIEKIG